MMNSFERMNEVIAYIEENLTHEIDYNKAAKIAACPISLFQRFFVYITNISLAEYIRRRRLTQAALELQQASCKIIDIAIKYGYESHSSFSRAFKEYHGISPTHSGDPGVLFTIFPRISFPVLDQNFNTTLKKGAIELNRTFQEFKNLRYRFDTVTMPQSLKFVALPVNDDISRIDLFHTKYMPLVKNRTQPLTEIGLLQNMTTFDGQFEYCYGAVVDSLEDIPDDLIGGDTGFRKFAVMTVKFDTLDELFDDQTFKTAHENFEQLLPAEYKNQVIAPPEGESRGFGVIGGNSKDGTSLIEIYPHYLFEKIETCFYIPLING